MLLYERKKFDLDCKKPVSLAELSIKLLGNCEDVLFNIRLSTGEVIVCPYWGSPVDSEKVEDQPLWVQLQMDEDIAQFGTYFFFHAKESLDDFAHTMKPKEGEFDGDWKDDSSYSRIMRLIYLGKNSSMYQLGDLMKERKLWPKFNDFRARANYRFSKDVLELYGFPYIDDRPPISQWLKTARGDENYKLGQKVLQDWIAETVAIGDDEDDDDYFSGWFF